MAILHFQGKKIPLGVAVVHGILGAAGLLLLAQVVMGGGSAYQLPLILFVVAALGGFVLFANHLRGKPLPTPLIVIHGLVAVIAFLLLLKG